MQGNAVPLSRETVTYFTNFSLHEIVINSILIRCTEVRTIQI
jgi:hypothetical protein